MYGANKSLVALLENLSDEIQAFVVIPDKGPVLKHLKNIGATTFIIRLKTWMSRTRFKLPLRLLVNLIATFKVSKIIKNNNIDLVYTNSSVIPVGQWSAIICNKPHIWHIREYGWEDYGLKHDFGFKFFRNNLNKSSHVIAISNSIKEEVCNNLLTNVSVVYNGVIDIPCSVNDISLFEVEEIKIGIIGLIQKNKGQELAIKAVSKLRGYNISLHIAGSSTKVYKQYLEEICSNLRLENRIKFYGYLNDTDKFLNEMDIILMCSKKEGFGRVTVEAMSRGKIVVGTNSGGTSELIVNKENGFLFNGSSEELVNILKQIIDTKPYDIAKKALVYANENFLEKEYSKKIETIMIKVCEKYV